MPHKCGALFGNCDSVLCISNIATWCKGNTQDFDSCNRGSSPLVAAKIGSEAQMAVYGSYLRYNDGEEEWAKEALKKQLHSFIDSLCEKDDFWIKQEMDKSGKDPLNDINRIGWKITIPHMKSED